MFLIIQKGYVIFGEGLTAEQALEDMKQWIDSDSPMQNWTVDDFYTSYHTANDGDMVLLDPTYQDYDEVCNQYRF